jgi:oxygen-independent coproporphyrinogen III oxidase
MAGIYIHIPFCKKACIYCDFHFSTVLKNKSKIVDSIIREIELSSRFLKEKFIDTIYFGGGTPTLLLGKEFESILATLNEKFSISPNAEFTVEANPDDLSKEKLTELKQLGVNRLSIGVQSFFDEHLTFFNRSHTSDQSIEAIINAQKLGIKNISIDLIYGFNQLKEKQLINYLDMVKTYKIPHVSAYALTVEPKTVLDHLISKNKYPPLNESLALEQFTVISNQLEEIGLDHYEVSNFGKPGFYSQHNSSYWLGKTYLGIGPSAHSFNGEKRRWNVSNNTQYFNRVNKGELYFEEELLSKKDHVNELILTGLRTKWGISKLRLTQLPSNQVSKLEKELTKQIKKKVITENEEGYVLDKRFWFQADGIASDLFQV